MALGLQINFYDRVIMITSTLQQLSFIGKIMSKVWNYFALQLNYSTLKIFRLDDLEDLHRIALKLKRKNSANPDFFLFSGWLTLAR